MNEDIATSENYSPLNKLQSGYNPNVKDNM